MLSLHQAYEIKESLLAYLKATFHFREKALHQAFYDFILHPQEGMFKGPYISLKTGFVKAKEEEIAAIPLEIKPNWPPYLHQLQSWYRLSTQEQRPLPTIVTTGTGSGKTESFLYPILDYCYKERNRQGVKVIILYPMNALAGDQAKRLAEAIFEDDRLKGKITAGLFIGEGKDAKKYPKNMGPDHIIENRESILASPPDILLTNFKMLDYGLMKANYHDLWAFNIKDPSLLQFLVLDELHTYDGAQGTDVANLIRRLKLKLDLPKGQLCPIGTSATIGSGEDAPRLLADYASKIFEEDIDTTAIITENRISPEDFFGLDEELDVFLPRASRLGDTQLRKDEAFGDFLQRQVALWQLDGEDLANSLSKQRILKDLLIICQEAGGISSMEEIVRELSRKNPIFAALPDWDASRSFHPKQALIESLFALISSARMRDKRKSPFLYTQVQLWIRELSGLLRSVEEKRRFVWKDSLDKKEQPLGLPPWFCRECGASGWLAVKHDNKERFEREVNDVYQKFFTNHKNLFFAQPASALSRLDLPESGYETDGENVLEEFVSSWDLNFQEEDGETRVKILAAKRLDSKNKNDHVCPNCNSRNSVAIIGTRLATLSSIAMSQTLATDLDPQGEQERKVLAFTNSVQDAAHQAGFVEARNYRFTLRSSLQKVINQSLVPIRLDELVKAFMQYWKAHADERGARPMDAYYSRFFPKDYIGKSSPEDYKYKDRYDPAFIKEFDIRVAWEVFAEFGYNALIGRTLEKTGSSASYFDPDYLQKTWQGMQTWLETNGAIQSIQEEVFLKFLSLLLHRVRTRGAISHPYLGKFRTQNLQLWDLNWMRDSRHFLNQRFGPRTRIPKLLTAQPERRGLLDTSYTKNKNWFHSYFKKSFPLASDYPDFVNEFYQQLFEVFSEVGLMDKRQAKDQYNYALNPQSLLISNQVYDLECNQCGELLHSGDADMLGLGGKCLSFRCQGVYQAREGEQEINYYQAVYNRQRSPRIYAADHTGLLERKDREILESDFKKRPHFDSKNAMLATSTLEMGIDIGSLNTAYNNSIPPLPSNFLQRIGRAGRASGSALIINFARSQAHDLFYFQEPMDMMAGEVSTPGCYLEAKEILRRHYFAACVDAWTSDNPAKNHIPTYIRNLKIEKLDLSHPDFFMNRIINFSKAGEQQLFDAFKKRYSSEGEAPPIFQDLLDSLLNESFYEFYRQIFQKLKSELEDLQAKRKDIESQIEILNLGTEDPLRLELEGDSKSLGGIIISIKKRNILEHLTNVGGLPNYAFPETGVSMMARVMGSRAEGSQKAPLNKEYEIVRPAITALQEFAPDNHFYSQGYKFQISGVNTFDWADEGVFHKKRFCSKCDHIEIDSKAPKGNCPKCDDESWRASSNVLSFARLLGVKSFNSRYTATLGDSKDERESIIFNRSRHFRFKQDTSRGAWAISEIPFGMEFVKQVDIEDVNLGQYDLMDARKIKMNEMEFPAHGFVTCNYCGKSTSNHHHKELKDMHYGYCKHKEHAYEGKADEVFEEVFFYREMKTEALKVLLPVQELNGEAESKMFRAGIELGLKKYYKGNPQHIAISEYREFNHKTLRFDRYLVLYDKVPGGTGYLEQLFDKNEFSQLLQLAYEGIRDCSCQYRGKDGCYRCIFTYGNQYSREGLSRERAELRFEEIIRKLEGWDRQSMGLSEVASSGKIEESELEERFIRSFRTLSSTEETWNLTENNEGNGITYDLQYQDKDSSLSYRIQPQYNLGPAQDIKYQTRADFMLICTEALWGGKDYRDEIPRIAIYLDGYQYHASEQYNKFSNDLQKRKTIIENMAYQCWVLTWADMERFDMRFLEGKEHDGKRDYLSQKLLEQGFADSRNKLVKGVNREKRDISAGHNSMERLLELLKYPLQDEVFYRSWSFYLAYFQRKFLYPSFPPNTWEEAFQSSSSETYYMKNSLNRLVKFQGLEENELFEGNSIINPEKCIVKSRVIIKNQLTIDKVHWENFWIYFNLIQFFDWEDPEGEQIIQRSDSSTVFNEEVLEELLPLFASEYQPLIRQLFSKGYITSEADEVALNSLLDEGGNTIAEAELIIPHIKLVFEPLSDNDKKVFERAGFTVKDPEEIKNIEI